MVIYSIIDVDCMASRFSLVQSDMNVHARACNLDQVHIHEIIIGVHVLMRY